MTKTREKWRSLHRDTKVTAAILTVVLAVMTLSYVQNVLAQNASESVNIESLSTACRGLTRNQTVDKVALDKSTLLGRFARAAIENDRQQLEAIARESVQSELAEQQANIDYQKAVVNSILDPAGFAEDCRERAEQLARTLSTMTIPTPTTFPTSLPGATTTTTVPPPTTTTEGPS